MSIYATLWCLRFPRHGDTYPDCEWIEVWGQGVPAHIGTPTPGYGYEDGDPYAEFLPPAVPAREDGSGLRAVVVVRAGSRKDVQRYIDPLLVLSGQEYEAMSFDTLYQRIYDILQKDV